MKTIRFILLVLAMAPLARAAEPPGDLKNALPTPEFYVKHRKALGFTDAQAETLRKTIETMNRDFFAADAEMTARARELQAAVEDGTQPPEAVAQRLDALLQSENRAKAVRFGASLAARRMLTPEQWEQARALMTPAPVRARGGPASSLPEDARVTLQKKLERVRALTGEVFPAGPPPDFRRRFNDLQNKVRNGQVEAADTLFDQLIADMEMRRAAPAANNPKP